MVAVGGWAPGCHGSENELAVAVREKIRLDRPVEALELARALVKKDPKSSRGLSTLATALYRDGHFDEAEKTARKALKLDKADPDALVALARCLRTRGEGEKARKRLEQALESAPHHPTAVRMMSGAMDLNEEREATLKLARLYVRLNPEGKALFVEHLRKMIKVVEGLEGKKLNVLPDWEQRPKRIVLPMRMTSRGPCVQVTLGADKRCWCLFDTGEESITLARRSAERLQAEKLVDLPTATATGIERMGLVLASRVSAKDYSISNVLCAVGTVNIVGPGIFRGYRVKMDIDARQLILTRQNQNTVPGKNDLKGAPPGHQRVRFRRIGRMAWFPISTPNPAKALRERPAWGLLDTGCEPVCVLTPRYLKALKSERGKGPLALPIRSSFGGAARAKGRDEIMKVLPEFTFSMPGCTATVQGAVSSASVAAICRIVETEVDLIVGWPVIKRHFKSIELDFERCVMTFEPRVLQSR